MVTPAAKREAVAHLRTAFEMSERRACKTLGCCRMTVRNEAIRLDNLALRERMKAIAHERRRFGYRRLHALLRREGYVVNHKRLFPLYREEKLRVRRRGGRKRAIGTPAPMLIPLAPNQRCSLDFVSDQLTDCRRFRVLTVVDDCTRECLGLVADTSLSGQRVARELDRIIGRARPAEDGGRRQRQRVHQQRPFALGRRDADRLALHRAGQADPERLHRKLQWAAARRVLERDAVLIIGPRPRHAGDMAGRLQCQQAPFRSRLADAYRVRPHLPAA
jgi:putative transposase